MKGVLFDLEGTLVNSGYQSNPEILDNLHIETKKMLLKSGVPLHVLNQEEKSVYLRNLAYDWMEKFSTLESLDNLKKNIESFLKQYDINSAESSEIYYDTIEVLDYLKNKNIKLGLVTNTSKIAADFMLDKWDIKHFFCILITRDDVYKIKPDPGMIHLALSYLDTTENFMVGDSKVDVMAAKKANIHSILIKRDLISPNYHSDYLISTLNELKNIF